MQHLIEAYPFLVLLQPGPTPIRSEGSVIGRQFFHRATLCICDKTNSLVLHCQLRRKVYNACGNNLKYNLAQLTLGS